MRRGPLVGVRITVACSPERVEGVRGFIVLVARRVVGVHEACLYEILVSCCCLAWR